MKSTATSKPRSLGPRIGEAFPDAFTRATPIVHEQQPLIFGASLLRFHPIEAALVLAEKMDYSTGSPRERFLGGYSVLAGLVKRDPRKSYEWLYEPCGKFAVSIRTLKSEERLGTLLNLFQESRFGFTVITESHLKAMIGMSDVLRLYGEGAIATDLKARDVASPAIGVDPKTTLSTALKLMFELRVRKLLIKGSRALVSDREIISYVFSPRKLNETREAPASLATTRIAEAAPIEIKEVAGNTPLGEVAGALLEANGNTLMCEGGVVTPWDVTIKPWGAGRLRFKAR